uniref:C-type lectin domain-containing protein n=1 Tax=Chelydra serpentina TaxID=8475 RepID=A0A8C3RZN0_CHESE
ENKLNTFLLRHKGVYDHWIGLRREQGQPWKWTNGTEFNHTFVIRGGGNCAYLNDEKGVSSSRCYMERRWICCKPEVSVMGKGTALEGGSK